MTQNDPTDHALAAIASILDKPESDASHEPIEDSTGPSELRLAEEILTAPRTPPAPPLLPPDPPQLETHAAAISDESYSKIGPGPLAALRFKWTARRGENGGYFVDETIGENSSPITTGPMSREAAIKLVDDRERHARQRFEELRSQMSGSTFES